jgi:hypothetical protein
MGQQVFRLLNPLGREAQKRVSASIALTKAHLGRKQQPLWSGFVMGRTFLGKGRRGQYADLVRLTQRANECQVLQHHITI